MTIKEKKILTPFIQQKRLIPQGTLMPRHRYYHLELITLIYMIYTVKIRKVTAAPCFVLVGPCSPVPPAPR